MAVSTVITFSGMTPCGVIQRYPTDVSEEPLVSSFTNKCEAGVNRFEHNGGSYYQTARLHAKKTVMLFQKCFVIGI
jgi:hypothetical protein